MSFMIYRIEFITMVMIITKFAAYDSDGLLGLDKSERIVCRINSDAFIKKTHFFFSDDRLLAGHNRALDWMK